MKNLKVLLTLCAILMIGLSFNSCEPEEIIPTVDPCADVTCQNGGTCDNGTCGCPDGFTGTNCEIEDKCVTQNPDCQNGGTCDDGTCDCPVGSEGEACEIISADKFIGVFDGSTANPVMENCGTGPFTYASEIQKHPTDFGKIQIYDLGFYGVDEVHYWIDATLTSATTIEFSMVFGTVNGAANYYNMTGTGEYNATTRVLVITYTCIYSNGSGGTTTDTCTSTFTYS